MITPEDKPAEAIAGSLLVHAPPVTPSVNVVVTPTQTLALPETEVGKGFIVTTIVATHPVGAI